MTTAHFQCDACGAALIQQDDLLIHPATDDLRARCDALVAALERIADMRDRDGNAIEMHRDELRGIARAALAAAKGDA